MSDSPKVIFNDVKTMLELDIEDTIYDDQLLIKINSAISYLIKNKVPLASIEQNSDISLWLNQGLTAGDYAAVINWIENRLSLIFDKSILQPSSVASINAYLDDILYQLKGTYDVEQVTSDANG